MGNGLLIVTLTTLALSLNNHHDGKNKLLSVPGEFLSALRPNNVLCLVIVLVDKVILPPLPSAKNNQHQE